MNKLSRRLSSVYAGCSIAYSKVNHIMYADDIVLLSPAVPGLRNLVNVCEFLQKSITLFLM